jgi:D-alanyl-D-alanine carboxypeptidase
MDFANRGFMGSKRGRALGVASWLLLALGAWCIGGNAWPRQEIAPSASAAKAQGEKPARATGRFAERAERLIQLAPVDQGEWGLLIVDATTGETLYEKNAEKYFVPASNMKLLTTALALDTLGPDYRFRTTVETNGVIYEDGKLSGDLILKVCDELERVYLAKKWAEAELAKTGAPSVSRYTYT